MFKLEEFMGKRVLKSSLLGELAGDDGVVAFFTTRDLPLKSGERNDLVEEVEQNKKLVCKGLDIPLENLVIPQQTHSDNVAVIQFYPSPQPSPPRGEGESAVIQESDSTYSPIHLFTHSPFNDTDALITNERNIALALNFADCVPIMFYDPVKKVVGAAHAGWRGTAAKISVKTIGKMNEEFGSNPEDIIAVIGPCIGKCCFQVGQDVAYKLLKTVSKEQFTEVIDGACVDLKLINKFQLLASGLKKIDVSEYCTSCKTELFFSYRKENAKTARHSAVIMLK